MASEMIERVAKAIFKVKFDYFSAKNSIVVPIYEGNEWIYEIDARAAIEAMRDYTESMSQVGGGVPIMQFGNDLPVGQSIAERCYLAMIDEALK